LVSPGAVLRIDLAAVRRNYRALTERVGAAKVAGVVKADGYGLGASWIAEALAAEGCATFFVATFDEALALRDALPEVDIHVFDGVQPGEEGEFAAQRIVPVLNSLPMLEQWHAKGRGAPADLHIDTGMSRLGLDKAELATLLAEPKRLDSLAIDVVMSHLAVADQPDHPLNAQQLSAFQAAAPKIPAKRKSFANSAGVFLGPDYHFDLARVGLALYGANPLPGRANPMAQVIRLQGKILQLRSVDAGGSVGYGATHCASRASRIATVALGYADGYPLSLSNRGTAFVGEIEIPVVGRVSMDLITLDVTDVPPAQAVPGGMVDFIGPHNPVDVVAERAGTIAYEILTGLGKRLQRDYAS
jgi:alanine racemase